MATITVGYDFAVDEVPTFEKFMLQAQGLQVTDISIANIQEIIVGKITGNVSGGTGASLPQQEGWIWADPGGNIWVQTAWNLSGVTEYKPCILSGRYGGWNTNRFITNGPSAMNTGMPIWPRGHTGVTESPETREGRFETDTTGVGTVGVYRDSPGASGTRIMITGRGCVDSFMFTTIPREPPFGSVDWKLWFKFAAHTQSEDIHSAEAHAQYAGQLVGAGTTGFASDQPPTVWNDPHFAYHFGGPLFGTG